MENFFAAGFQAAALRGYVQLVRGIRKVALVNCALALAATLSILGAVIFILGLSFALTGVQGNITVPTIVLGAFLASAPLSVIIWLLPESRWLHFFRVDQLIEGLQAQIHERRPRARRRATQRRRSTTRHAATVH